MKKFLILAVFSILWTRCLEEKNNSALIPDFITEKTYSDTDDPAIWINKNNPEQSLILGTDKHEENGGIYVFNLKGKLIKEKCLTGLKRPNNIDVEYGFNYNSTEIDIAVFTERNRNVIRVLSLPDFNFIDNGGIPVFENEENRDPMGIGLYKDSFNQKIYAIVSRKSGPSNNYLGQYLLKDSSGIVIGQQIRNFGAFKGGKEIESIAVDDKMGYIYYSDEGAGVRKYYANPDSSNLELALLASSGFTEDHEGISIYATSENEGYIIVSDQGANLFHIFRRIGSETNPHEHPLIAILPFSTLDSDGSEVTNFPIPNLYPKGFFVAMSTDTTFQIYDWQKIEDRILSH